MPRQEMTSAPMITCAGCKHSYADTALFCPNCGTPKAREVAANSDPLIGKVLGERFQILELLGHGGSGTIYRAEHVTLRRKVAIKVLHNELSRDDLAVERFRREATTVAEIDNEHIVEIHDFGRTNDGRLYLAMELLEGETLDHVLAREKTLSVERTADILIQVGEALMEAHAIGYVHRDLRPRNVYLAVRRGKANFVKLLDFGLAKLVETDAQAASTSLGMTFGDPRYMSPEQARGDRIDRRADIYQLGCVAYEMLTGAPPFTGNRVFDILSKQVTEIPAPLPTRRPGVPLWIEAAITKMLAKDADNRFATTTRLVEALRLGLETGQVMEDEIARRRESIPPPSVSRVMQKMGISAPLDPTPAPALGKETLKGTMEPQPQTGEPRRRTGTPQLGVPVQPPVAGQIEPRPPQAVPPMPSHGVYVAPPSGPIALPGSQTVHGYSGTNPDDVQYPAAPAAQNPAQTVLGYDRNGPPAMPPPSAQSGPPAMPPSAHSGPPAMPPSAHSGPPAMPPPHSAPHAGIAPAPHFAASAPVTTQPGPQPGYGGPSAHVPLGPVGAPSAHAPSAHAPSAHAPSAHAPSAHAPSAHAPSAHAPSAHAPSAHAPSAHAPSAHAPSGPAAAHVAAPSAPISPVVPPAPLAAPVPAPVAPIGSSPIAGPSQGMPLAPVVGSPSGPTGRSKRSSSQLGPGDSAAWFDDGDRASEEADKIRARKTISPSTTDLSLYDDMPPRRRWPMLLAIVGGLALIGGTIAFALTRGGDDKPSAKEPIATAPAPVATQDVPPSQIISPDGSAATPTPTTNNTAKTGSAATSASSGKTQAASTSAGTTRKTTHTSDDAASRRPGGGGGASDWFTNGGGSTTAGTTDTTDTTNTTNTNPTTTNPTTTNTTTTNTTTTNTGTTGVSGADGPVDPYGGGTDSPPPDTAAPEKKAEFFANLGKQQLASGDAAGAAASFKKALELDAKNIPAIIGMGEIALRQGLFGDAIAHLKKAARLAPKSSHVFTLLGEAYLGTGNNAVAAENFKKALQLDPDNTRARDGFNEAQSRVPPTEDD